jgi:hypothetical protein
MSTQWDPYERLRHNLTNHPPVSEAVVRDMENLRLEARALGETILGLVPESREQSLALTNLEQTVMWAIAGLARNQEGREEEG